MKKSDFFALFLQKNIDFDISNYQKDFISYLESKKWVKEPANLYEQIGRAHV